MRAPDAKRSARETEKAGPRAREPTAERRLKGEAENKAARRAGEAALALARLRRDQARDRRGHPRLAPRGPQIHKY